MRNASTISAEAKEQVNMRQHSDKIADENRGNERTERAVDQDVRLEWERRNFLRRTLAVGGSAAVTGAGLTTPAAASGNEYTTREKFDEEADIYPRWQGETNDSDSSIDRGGLLTWTRSYVLQAFLLMYRAHGDTAYLDTFIEMADDILEQRDNERGVEDYRGKSLPAWRCDHPYSVGKVTFTDREDRPTLEVRSALSYANDATAIIGPGTKLGTFRLTVHNSVYDWTTTYDSLTMDPDSPNYVVKRINKEGFKSETPDTVLVTVEDVRESPSDADNPEPGKSDLVSGYYIYPAHTGQITLPMASFARVVFDSPELRADAHYEDRAETYLQAAKDAVRVHDDEWRETEQGEGYYIYRPGAPEGFESSDMPFNHFLALSRTIIQIAAITGENEFVEKARKSVRTLKNDLREDEDGAYIWNYWWTKGEVAEGWSLDDPVSEYRPWYPGRGSGTPEFISKSLLDIHAATAAFRNSLIFEGDGPVFNGKDMNRFARTFTQNLVTEADGEPTVNRQVDGSGPVEIGDRFSPMWNVFMQWDEKIFDHSSAIYEAKGEDMGGAIFLLGISYLNYWSQQESSSIE